MIQISSGLAAGKFIHPSPRLGQAVKISANVLDSKLKLARALLELTALSLRSSPRIARHRVRPKAGPMINSDGRKRPLERGPSTLPQELDPRFRGGDRRWAAPALAASLALSGCISSATPILSDAKPVLGERGLIHVYTLSEGAARDSSVVSFQWNGSRYVLRGKSVGISDFTLHPYEGRDLVIQSTSQRAPRTIEYGLARRIADATYLIMQINEDDAESSMREKFCTRTPDASCRIATTEQIFAFARATADKPVEGGGLAVVLTAAAAPPRR
jgi:hypothetical protein